MTSERETKAKFRAVGSFLVRSRRLFVIVGDVVEGTVVPGMTVRLPLNPSLTVAASVKAVEYVDILHEGKSYMGLALEYEHPEELEFWMAMRISGEVLELNR